MANLQIDSTVLHNGTLIPGRKIENNQVVFPGAVIDLEADTRGLKAVAQDLIDRGIAHETSEPATHTLTLVNAAQEAMPINAPAGSASAPIADSLKRNLAFQKDLAAQKQAQVQPAQSQAPAQPQQPAPKQPTPEEVAAAAAAA